MSPNSASAQIVFSQNFSGGTNVSDYVGSGANLFDAISTANSTNLSWSINSGTLQGDRTLNSTGAATRTTDLPTSLGAIYRFDINIVDVTQAATSTLAFYVGSGFTTNSGAPAALTDIHSRFGINFADATANIGAQTTTVSPTDFKPQYGLNDRRGTIQLDNFSLVAIPEPGTWLAAAFTLAVLGWTQRRRLPARAVR